MNQAIELSGTPACRSATANPTKDAGISNGQTLTRTNNNPVTRIAQPGQSGHTVWGFEISIPASFGTRYDNAVVMHTTSNVERESEYGGPCEKRLLAIVMTIPRARRNPHHGQNRAVEFSAVRIVNGNFAGDVVD
jgi:hypothetical protein